MKQIILFILLFLSAGSLFAQSYPSQRNIEKAIFNYQQTGQLVSFARYQSETAIPLEGVDLFAGAIQSKNGYLSIKRVGENMLEVYCEQYVTEEHTQKLFTACGIAATLVHRDDNVIPGKY